MRRLLHTVSRRAALVVAFAYAVCVITPSAALAFAATDHAAHCLSIKSAAPAMAQAHQEHHVHQAAHRHAEPATNAHHAHQHDAHEHMHLADAATGSDSGPADTGNHQQPGQCCGLFCVTALTPATTVTAAAMPAPVRIEAFAARDLFGRYPDRIDRPPRSLVLI